MSAIYIPTIFFRLSYKKPNNQRFNLSLFSSLLVGHLTDVDATSVAMALHATGCVDSVSEQAVSRHLGPYHTCHDVARMDPNANLKVTQRKGERGGGGGGVDHTCVLIDP